MPATATTRLAPIPEGVPDRLSTGDVAAILGMSARQVRHHADAGRFGDVQPFKLNTHRIYTPEAVAAFAEAARRTPDWSKAASR